MAFSAGAEVSYGDLNLHQSGELLFSARTSSPLFGSYSTLFQANLQEKSLDQLSFFPEKVMLVNQGNMLQIQNRFGVFRADNKLENMRVIHQFPAFVHGQDIQTGKINVVGSSPDGAYLLYLREQTPGFGELLLYSIAQSRETVITTRVELSLDGPNASWAPDSNYFVYEKGGRLFYFSIQQFLNERVIAEEFRLIGPGRLSSICWSDRNDLYYIDGTVVQKISSPQFFTRSLYSGLLSAGEIVGKIPFGFDAAFDSFHISPNGQKMLVNKGGSNIFFYYLRSDDFLSTGDVIALPFLHLPRNSIIKRVVWSRSDMISILAGSSHEGMEKASIYRLDAGLIEAQKSFSIREVPGVKDMRLSPDQSQLALMYEDRVDIYAYFVWSKKSSHAVRDPLHIIWKSDEELIIAGRHSTVLVGIEQDRRQLICLSQHTAAGFTADGDIEIAGEEGIFRLNDNRAPVLLESSQRLEPALANADFRVFLENHAGAHYTNMVMIRDIRRMRTTPLFHFPRRNYEPFPELEEKPDFVNFTHGSRIRRREVALVFNAIDCVEGLTGILQTLKEFNVRATFFVNGEFIRRNPEAVRELSVSGHEIGSLFYVYYNMTDARFRVDRDFIKQGLARNEDIYNAVTGKELSLLWHAPFYFVNSDIIEASREMNYVYTGRDVDPLDWVVPGSAQATRSLLSAAETVERVIQLKRPGSIIPIRIGRTRPERPDYFFQKLDVLINSLTSLGYRAVTVSELIEHAR